MARLRNKLVAALEELLFRRTDIRVADWRALVEGTLSHFLPHGSQLPARLNDLAQQGSSGSIGSPSKPTEDSMQIEEEYKSVIRAACEEGKALNPEPPSTNQGQIELAIAKGYFKSWPFRLVVGGILVDDSSRTVQSFGFRVNRSQRQCADRCRIASGNSRLYNRATKWLPMVRSRTIVALLSLGLVLCLGSSNSLANQAPHQASQSTLPGFDEMVNLLQLALHTRIVPVTNFRASKGTWHISALKLSGDTLIGTYSPTPQLTFHVQSIHCTDKYLGERDDATILGPTETAAEFYEANVQFATYRPDDFSPCLLSGMASEMQTGTVTHETTTENADIVTSHGRAMRHLVNWLRFLNLQNDNPGRAANFFVTILDLEKAELLRLESSDDYERTRGELALFETLFPSSEFFLGASLSGENKGHARDFLTTRIRIRKKLSVFLPEASQSIKRDEALLANFR